MSFATDEGAINFFVDQDPSVTFAEAALRVATTQARTLIMNHLAHLTVIGNLDCDGAMFNHRSLRSRDGQALKCKVTHYSVRGNLCRVLIGVQDTGFVLIEQEMCLTELFPQIGAWLTKGPRPVDLAP